MEKPAITDFPLFEPIANRWSPAAFSGRPLSPGDIGSLFEAARWASSCYNEQPWFFIIAANGDSCEFERLLSCLVPGNQIWARNASLLILTFANLTFVRNGKPNRHAWHDVGLAAQNLIVQAMSMGLFAHQMAGFDSDKVRTTYSVPDGVDPVTAIAIGYPGSKEDLPEELQAREAAPRSRKPLSTILFQGMWGKNPSVLAK